ncbi:MAG: hypothetical protein V3T70_03045 [Phycisphaerae bacterium]
MSRIGWGIFLLAPAVLISVGCAQHAAEPFTDGLAVRLRRAGPSRSALFGPAPYAASDRMSAMAPPELDPLALQIGRSDWPDAFRDVFDGEIAYYRETIYDVQGTLFGGYGYGGSHMYRRFQSVREGSFRR